MMQDIIYDSMYPNERDFSDGYCLPFYFNNKSYIAISYQDGNFVSVYIHPYKSNGGLGRYIVHGLIDSVEEREMKNFIEKHFLKKMTVNIKETNLGKLYEFKD